MNIINKEFSFSEFMKWAFYGIVGFCAMYMVAILSDMNKNINELNTKIAVVMERNSHYEYRLNNIENRLNEIEK